MKHAVQKLITREDAFHVHKTLGMLCLFSFVYRYLFLMIGSSVKALGFDEPGATSNWITMAMHTALSCSSLIFHVIRHRMQGRPMIMYEEYRLHAIIFTIRSLSVYLFGALVVPLSLPRWATYALLTAVVLVHHMAADYVTKVHGKRGNTAVRTNRKHSRNITIVLRLYSLYQFVAMASHLVPNGQLAALGFNTLIAIQSSAFLMTLYRKNIISSMTHGLVYSACLVLSTAYILCVHSVWRFYIGILIAFYLRLTRNTNKYALWICFAVSQFSLETSMEYVVV